MLKMAHFMQLSSQNWNAPRHPSLTKKIVLENQANGLNTWFPKTCHATVSIDTITKKEYHIQLTCKWVQNRSLVLFNCANN